jgi:hypothetical protein
MGLRVVDAATRCLLLEPSSGPWEFDNFKDFLEWVIDKLQVLQLGSPGLTAQATAA